MLKTFEDKKKFRLIDRKISNCKDCPNILLVLNHGGDADPYYCLLRISEGKILMLYWIVEFLVLKS